MDNQNKKVFNIGRFFVGLAIIFFGLALLAQNAGWVNINTLNLSWSNLWPVFLILIGLSMLSSRGVIGTVVGILFALLVLLATVILILIPSSSIVSNEIKIMISNPASTYCQNEGGRVDVRTNSDGSQTGYCVFSDNSECDEWAFMLKRCSVGQNVQPQVSVRSVNIRPNVLVLSPLRINGEAKGNWFFEASFPVKIYDSNGKLLGSVPAQAQGEWMTENFVPFSATLTFEKPETETGYLVLERDNPSGLPENGGEYKIPVRFK